MATIPLIVGEGISVRYFNGVAVSFEMAFGAVFPQRVQMIAFSSEQPLSLSHASLPVGDLCACIGGVAQTLTIFTGCIQASANQR